MANLNDLLNHINFTTEDLEEIDEALINLIDTIKTKANEGKVAKIIEYYKFGSIQRKTKIKPLDDVDIIYVVGTAEKQIGSNMHTITNCSLSFGPEKHQPENNISSIILLNDLRSAISETYSRSEVRRNQEVVNVYLSSYEVGFDIVPAFDITNMGYLLIPAGKGNHNWKETKPQAGVDFFNSANTRHNGLLRNVIKIIKYWFKKKKIKTPGSYHLESVLCYAFNASFTVYDSLSNALYYAYSNINYSNYLITCPDPTYMNRLLDSGLSTEDTNKIIAEANSAKALLNNIPEFVKYIDEDIE